jgi:hypothetical protein
MTIKISPELNGVKKWGTFDMFLLGRHRQVRILAGCPSRNVECVNVRMIVGELQPDQIGRGRSVDGNAEKTLTELLSGGRITVRTGFGIRRILRYRMDEPKSGLETCYWLYNLWPYIVPNFCLNLLNISSIPAYMIFNLA